MFWIYSSSAYENSQKNISKQTRSFPQVYIPRTTGSHALLCFPLDLLEHYHKPFCRNDGPNYFMVQLNFKVEKKTPDYSPQKLRIVFLQAEFLSLAD